MGLSHHSEDYAEMKEEFLDVLEFHLGDFQAAVKVWDKLNSIMNNYGAVSWT